MKNVTNYYGPYVVMFCYTVTLKYRYQSFDTMRFMRTMQITYVHANSDYAFGY